MASPFREQFATLIRRSSTLARAYMCDGDASAAVIWDDDSEITIRLSLRGEEIWLIAGSGTLLRFVAASDGEFDHEGIAHVIDQILHGAAVEFFGVAEAAEGDVFATGFEIGQSQGFAGGLNESQARFRARLAGPMASASLTILD